MGSFQASFLRTPMESLWRGGGCGASGGQAATRELSRLSFSLQHHRTQARRALRRTQVQRAIFAKSLSFRARIARVPAAEYKRHAFAFCHH